MCPRCRSGAVGSNPTLTTSGAPPCANRSSLAFSSRGADDVHAALGQVGQLFVDGHHRWLRLPDLAGSDPASTPEWMPMRASRGNYTVAALTYPRHASGAAVARPAAARPPQGAARPQASARITGAGALRLPVRAAPRRGDPRDARGHRAAPMPWPACASASSRDLHRSETVPHELIARAVQAAHRRSAPT